MLPGVPVVRQDVAGTGCCKGIKSAGAIDEVQPDRGSGEAKASRLASGPRCCYQLYRAAQFIVCLEREVPLLIAVNTTRESPCAGAR